MQFIKKYWVAIVAILYSGFILVYTLAFMFLVKGENQLLPSNELGDFLAGAFAPLAFFILIMGYIQQGKELQQNTAALQLQADELKNSVEQQKQMLDVTRQQYKDERLARHHAAQPSFVINIHQLFNTAYSDDMGQHFYHHLEIEIKNLATSVTNVNIHSTLHHWTIEQNKEIGNMGTGDQITITICAETCDVFDKAQFDINFIDGQGNRSTKKFYVNYNPYYYVEDKNRYNITYE